LDTSISNVLHNVVVVTDSESMVNLLNQTLHFLIQLSYDIVLK
jgi:hypothetical protein